MHTEIMKQVEKMYRIMWKNVFIINMYMVFIEGTILKFWQIQFHVYQLYRLEKVEKSKETLVGAQAN